MYTLEEINEAAKSKAWLMFWIWMLVFGIPIAFLNYEAMSCGEFITELILCDFFLPFSAVIMACLAYSGEKKKKYRENEEEERLERERHYRKMEDLLEKMSKDKEQP